MEKRTCLHNWEKPDLSIWGSQTCIIKNHIYCFLEIQLSGPVPTSHETASLMQVIWAFTWGNIGPDYKTGLETCQCSQYWLKIRVHERTQVSHQTQGNNRKEKSRSNIWDNTSLSMYYLNMVTKYMLVRDSIGVHKWKIIRDRGRRLEDIWVSVKKEKHKIGHCKDFKKTTRLVRKCKNSFLDMNYHRI